MSMTYDPVQGRPWSTDLPLSVIKQIQYSHALSPERQFTYKGVVMWKNPFDLALYTRLIDAILPRTIIELGSYKGGSALWFADQMLMHHIRPNVISVDINPVGVPSLGGLTFLQGDARYLANVFEDSLDAMPRPWLVVEDADHTAATTLLVMKYFHDKLHSNEYIVIEDGIIEVMGERETYGGGPASAINLFLVSYPDEYLIDSAYCDYFGYNYTWNLNGYIRRL